MKFPDGASALVDAMDLLVPEYVPQAGDTMETIQRYAGKRELVLQMKVLRDQSKNPTIARRPRR